MTVLHVITSLQLDAMIIVSLDSPFLPPSRGCRWYLVMLLFIHQKKPDLQKDTQTNSSMVDSAERHLPSGSSTMIFIPRASRGSFEATPRQQYTHHMEAVSIESCTVSCLLFLPCSWRTSVPERGVKARRWVHF
ncbi:hypothetical protein M408DRAFT_234604 [Serendipita vermifera MAFF 305830]|uniref:Uncharacterized protein n=1 Tax=Serendipita vermifera MAFF 305830 TaxID=933852 RepID=A0A0C2X4P7_SERVB|nr:hypothetical protein M408DRAFT_234604 [Serendipita vermifera MAFF 305830]